MVTSPCGADWVNRQALLGSPISRVQYGYSPFGESRNARWGHPPSERWVHFCTAGCVFLRVALDSAQGGCQNGKAQCAWGCSSAGRALPSQGRGRGFESLHLHQVISSRPSGRLFCCPMSRIPRRPAVVRKKGRARRSAPLMCPLVSPLSKPQTLQSMDSGAAPLESPRGPVPVTYRLGWRVRSPGFRRPRTRAGPAPDWLSLRCPSDSPSSLGRLPGATPSLLVMVVPTRAAPIRPISPVRRTVGPGRWTARETAPAVRGPQKSRYASRRLLGEGLLGDLGDVGEGLLVGVGDLGEDLAVELDAG